MPASLSSAADEGDKVDFPLAEYEEVSDVPGHLLREIEHFFEVFKDLEGSDIGVLGWEGAQEAEELLEEAIRTEEDEEESAKASSGGSALVGSPSTG